MITVDIDHDVRPDYWRVTLRTSDGALYTSSHRYRSAYITTGARAVIDGLHADGIPVTTGPVLALRLGPANLHPRTDDRVAACDADPWGEGAIRYPPDIARG